MENLIGILLQLPVQINQSDVILEQKYQRVFCGGIPFCMYTALYPRLPGYETVLYNTYRGMI